MQVVEVVATITSSEHINVSLICIGSVHVAGTRALPTNSKSHPFESFKIKDVKIIGSKRTLPKPSSNDVEFVANQSSSVTIPALWLRTICHTRLLGPDILLGIKDP